MMSKRAVTVLAVTTLALAVTLAPAPARAQPGVTAPLAVTVPPEKSESRALGLSLLGTAAPIMLVISAAGLEQEELALLGGIGVLVGPSLGHWYAGRYFTGGLLVRGIGTALMIAGFAQAIDDCATSCGSDGEGRFLTGAALFVGGTVYDIATATRSARRWNERTLNVVPLVVPSAGGPTPGVGLGGRF